MFAEGQAAVVAEALIAQHRGSRPDAAYDGRGICYLEFGDDQVAKVDVTFVSGQRPVGVDGRRLRTRTPPTRHEFGTRRIRRWFGREWTT